MSEQKVKLKNSYFAAIFAFLIPGAGHLYQGRYFKAIINFVCIMGIFIWGLTLGEWQVLFVNVDQENALPQKDIGFYTQVFIGVPGLYAIYQSKRYYSKDNSRQTTLTAPLSTAFEGEMINEPVEGTKIEGIIKGNIDLKPVTGDLNSQTLEGTFNGTLNENEPIQLVLGRNIELERPIGGTLSRGLKCDIVAEENGQLISSGEIAGTFPRTFLNHFGSPITENQLQGLNGKLGKRYDLAKVFTWIAGLLNLLAIWDAFDGPAYGTGKEEKPEEADDKAKAAA